MDFLILSHNSEDEKLITETTKWLVGLWHGTEANEGWLTEVGFANKYGRSLVTTASLDSIEAPSDGLLTCLKSAPIVEFNWSLRPSYQNNLLWGTALTIVPHRYSVTSIILRVIQYPNIKKTSERQPTAALVP